MDWYHKVLIFEFDSVELNFVDLVRLWNLFKISIVLTKCTSHPPCERRPTTEGWILLGPNILLSTVLVDNIRLADLIELFLSPSNRPDGPLRVLGIEVVVDLSELLFVLSISLTLLYFMLEDLLDEVFFTSSNGPGGPLRVLRINVLILRLRPY